MVACQLCPLKARGGGERNPQKCQQDGGPGICGHYSSPPQKTIFDSHPWMRVLLWEPGSLVEGFQWHREGNGTPLQYFCLENPMDGGAWWAAVHGVTKSQTRLSDFTFTFHFHALKKEMATHSSVFAWRILGTGEPGGLLSMGSHRVGHNWSDLAVAAVVKNKAITSFN